LARFVLRAIGIPPGPTNDTIFGTFLAPPALRPIFDRVKMDTVTESAGAGLA
jgi:hypothetical protein